jgi:hypothetical protein
VVKRIYDALAIYNGGSALAMFSTIGAFVWKRWVQPTKARVVTRRVIASIYLLTAIFYELNPGRPVCYKEGWNAGSYGDQRLRGGNSLCGEGDQI